MKRSHLKGCMFVKLSYSLPQILSAPLTPGTSFLQQEGHHWRTGAGFQVGPRDTWGHLPRVPLGAGGREGMRSCVLIQACTLPTLVLARNLTVSSFSITLQVFLVLLGWRTFLSAPRRLLAIHTSNMLMHLQPFLTACSLQQFSSHLPVFFLSHHIFKLLKTTGCPSDELRLGERSRRRSAAPVPWHSPQSSFAACAETSRSWSVFCCSTQEMPSHSVLIISPPCLLTASVTHKNLRINRAKSYVLNLCFIVFFWGRGEGRQFIFCKVLCVAWFGSF